MNGRQSLKNPYVTGGPVLDGRMFFGRDAVFHWIQQCLANRRARQVMLLYGEPKSGKSSVLRQVEAGRLGLAVTAVYVALPGLALDSESSFLGELAAAAAAGLAARGISSPELAPADFVTDPAQAFTEQFVRPLLGRVPGRLVFLWDEAGYLTNNERAGHLAQGILGYFQGLLEKQSRVALLCAFNGRPEDSPPLPLLDSPARQMLGPLPEAAAVALMRRPAPYNILQPARDYVLQLTGGRPQEIQQICHALFERWRAGYFGQVTVADVVTARRLAVSGAYQAAET